MSFRSVYRADAYYGHADQFITAYLKLAQLDAASGYAGIEKDIQQPSVKLLLLGHALELVCKGWLVLKEDLPKTVTKDQKVALQARGRPIPTTLRDYGHDLDRLAKAVVRYYPALQHWQDNGRIQRLNESYWGGGQRDYEYPEGNKWSRIPCPLDELAAFIVSALHALRDAIDADESRKPYPA